MGLPTAEPQVLFIVEREAWLEDNAVFHSLKQRFDAVVPWATLGPDDRIGPHFASKREIVVNEARNLIRLLRTRAMYRGKWLFVAAAGHYSFLAFAIVLRVLRRNPRVYLFNFYLHGLGGSWIVKRILRLLLGPHVRVLCQAEDEVEYLRGVRADLTLDYVPFCQGPMMKPEWIGSREYVFAGGFTNRDYDLLIRCAERMPGHEFVIACSGRNRFERPLPANTRVLRDQDWSAFHSLLGHSKVVVVPLRERVGSSGQMVALAAMEAGKPTIVSDAGGLPQYVEDGVDGFVYVLGDEDSLLGRLEWCMDAARSRSVGQAARASYLSRFVQERFDERVVAAVVEHASSPAVLP